MIVKSSFKIFKALLGAQVIASLVFIQYTGAAGIDVGQWARDQKNKRGLKAKLERIQGVCKKISNEVGASFTRDCNKVDDDLLEIFEYNLEAEALLFGSRCEQISESTQYIDAAKNVGGLMPGENVWTEISKQLSKRESIEFMGVFLQMDPDKGRTDCGDEEAFDTFTQFYKNVNKGIQENLLNFFPQELNELNQPGFSKFYHFYISAYLTQRLVDKGYDPYFASLVSYLNNANFELITLKIKKGNYDKNGELKDKKRAEGLSLLANYTGQFITLKTTDVFPETVDVPAEKKTDYEKMVHSDIMDIYLGYRGALFTAEVPRGEILSFNEFKNAIRQDYRRFVTNVVLQ